MPKKMSLADAKKAMRAAKSEAVAAKKEVAAAQKEFLADSTLPNGKAYREAVSAHIKAVFALEKATIKVDTLSE